MSTKAEELRSGQRKNATSVNSAQVWSVPVGIPAKKTLNKVYNGHHRYQAVELDLCNTSTEINFTLHGEGGSTPIPCGQLQTKMNVELKSFLEAHLKSCVQSGMDKAGIKNSGVKKMIVRSQGILRLMCLLMERWLLKVWPVDGSSLRDLGH